MLRTASLAAALVCLALMGVLIAGALPVTANDDDAVEAVTWLTDLDAARAKARETGRPILAVFR